MAKVVTSLSKSTYAVLRKLMFSIPPERIHELTIDALRVLQLSGPINRILGRFLPVRDDVLKQDVCGITFPRPLGLAAGFDKAGVCPDVWTPVGFGFAELGTVTASPQPGNPSPRLFRLPKDRAIINRMGFNNPGAAEVGTNIRRRRYSDVLGVNIGKTKVVPAEESVNDYRRCADLVANLADYLVVNVSSPNTPGLRDLQAVEALRPILATVLEVAKVPVFVKIAPDLSNEDVDAVADLALELGLAGIVATNTTISRGGLKSSDKEVDKIGAGGLSGLPLKPRALEVLQRLHGKVGNQLVLIASGGVSSAEDAWERIAAGASLVQVYTAMIYGGPGWIRRVNRELAQQVKDQGMSNISEAIGCHKHWIQAN